MKENYSRVICIGGGISGLYFALKAAEFTSVLLIVKDTLEVSNSFEAKGGIAAPFSSVDTIESHIVDTMLAGDGLGDEIAVSFMISQAQFCILDLFELGVSFTLDHENKFDLLKEGGHSHNRIVHAKDETGKKVINQLIQLVRNHSSITIMENHFVVDLLKNEQSVVGVKVFNTQIKKMSYLYAQNTVLATGGAGNIYKYNTNPSCATGDGFGMANRVGADCMNMEFVQFHPTMLYIKDRNENILISEALRGAGAVLKNIKGKSFMDHLHPMGSLAPRDIVARSMVHELTIDHCEYLYLDATMLNSQLIKSEFPYIYNQCLKYGIDIAHQFIPVVPAAHYMCGGIVTNLHAQTSIKHLYAIGEVACTGVHGANRLASNSLLEGLVFAKAAAEDIRNSTLNYNKISDVEIDFKYSVELIEYINKIKFELNNLMWDSLGIIRNLNGIRCVLEKLYFWRIDILGFVDNTKNIRELFELLNMIDTSILIAKAASKRDFNIGTHFLVN